MPTEVHRNKTTFYLGFAIDFFFSNKRIDYRGNKSDRQNIYNMSDRYVWVHYTLLFMYMFENTVLKESF